MQAGFLGAEAIVQMPKSLPNLIQKPHRWRKRSAGFHGSFITALNTVCRLETQTTSHFQEKPVTDLNRKRQIMLRVLRHTFRLYRLISFALALVLSAAALAGDAALTIGPITIQVPAGFENPIQQQQQGATVVAFGKQHRDSSASTLLQVSIYDFGSKLSGLPDAQRGSAAAMYVLEFVGGVERRRTNFRRSEPIALKIAGVPAARLQWTGQAGGLETVGVMYCFVVGTKVISFHTQDLGTQPTAAMKDAVKAFEGVKLNVGG